jgi:hypothetical protein
MPSVAVVVLPVVVPRRCRAAVAIAMPSVAVVVPPVALLPLAVVVPPVVVPPVALLPLTIVVPPVVMPPVAVIVPPVAEQEKLIVESTALASNGDPLIFDAPNELIVGAANIENNSADASSDTSGGGKGFMGGEEEGV